MTPNHYEDVWSDRGRKNLRKRAKEDAVRTATMIPVPEFDKVIAKVRVAGKRHAKRTEISWMRSAIKYAEDAGCVVRRLDSIGRRGKTDLVVVTPNGYVWWPELKRDKDEKLAKLQEAEVQALRKRHQPAGLVDSLEHFKTLLDGFLLLNVRRLPLGVRY